MPSADNSIRNLRAKQYAARWAQLKGTAHEIFGVERIRPGQAKVLTALMEGRDVLTIMPTGSGKSLCYQLTQSEVR